MLLLRLVEVELILIVVVTTKAILGDVAEHDFDYSLYFST